MATDEQVNALYQRWNTTLAARLDYALEFMDTRSAAQAVAHAWLEVERENRALRTILDLYSYRPALRSAIDYESSMLAQVAGLVGTEEPSRLAVVVGRRYLDDIRSHGFGTGERRARSA
jgi:hypothetical protein